MEKNVRLLTIGQFAALHGINKKTLMWYDEIGLFHPAFINPENNYRYYNYHQSPVLETILLLRDLDVSIHEIQAFMKNRSAQSLKDLLKEKETSLSLQILHLQALQKTLNKHCQNMDTLLTMDLSEISIVEKEEQYLVTVNIDKDTSFEKEVEMITAETAKYHLGRLHDASYGSMIPVDSLEKGNFDHYTNLFIEIPSLIQSNREESSSPARMTPCQQTSLCGPSHVEGLHVQPRGNYIRAFHKGPWDQLPLRYQAIFNYARKEKLTLTGFSYEKGINETVIDQVEDYIVQIEIPVLTVPPIHLNLG